MISSPFHLVEYSPWPLTGSAGGFCMVMGLVSWFHGYGVWGVVLGLVLIVSTMYQWWRDVVRESTFQGYHTFMVCKGLRWGMILFITSEVMFFFAFFWAYFHSSLSPSIELGSCWPPVGIYPLNAFSVPLLNTAVLLASGFTVTWAHHSFMSGEYTSGLQGLFITVALGMYFSVLQAGEYWEAPFSLSDGVYGSSFFVATGFHGLHVLIGSTFLLVCLIRGYNYHFSDGHHFGFEAAAWYWHFVDVVWLFLYTWVYWWGA
uniref:Cytochrome c oxidase subunit 3 n=1 Tax=Owenia fusiformis TaxID=6347 RepID=A0A0S2N0E0_OWEFU|nr:cytochrome c oxidase subunit III [Owenia fusiformis]ALO81688.1 cytochrome c oxidase subunit III [Owenia fusiformis]